MGIRKETRATKKQQTRHDQNRLQEEKQSRIGNSGAFPTIDVRDRPYSTGKHVVLMMR